MKSMEVCRRATTIANIYGKCTKHQNKNFKSTLLQYSWYLIALDIFYRIFPWVKKKICYNINMGLIEIEPIKMSTSLKYNLSNIYR